MEGRLDQYLETERWARPTTSVGAMSVQTPTSDNRSVRSSRSFVSEGSPRSPRSTHHRSKSFTSRPSVERAQSLRSQALLLGGAKSSSSQRKMSRVADDIHFLHMSRQDILRETPGETDEETDEERSSSFGSLDSHSTAGSRGSLLPGLKVSRKDLSELRKLDDDLEVEFPSDDENHPTRAVVDKDGDMEEIDFKKKKLSIDGFGTRTAEVEVVPVKGAGAHSRLVQFLYSKRCCRLSVAICLFWVFIVGGCFLLLGLLGVFRSDSEYESRLDMDPKAPRRNGVSLPRYIERNVADWIEGHDISGVTTSDKEIESAQGDVPFLWTALLAGGTTTEDVFGSCWGLVQASEVGIYNEHDHDTEVDIVEVAGISYVDVDTTSPAGIKRAKQLNLASSGIADVIVSPLFHEAVTGLFSDSHRARLMVIMRHPIDRAVSMYHYLIKGMWPDSSENAKISHMTLQEYADSEYIENNWFTRSLVNKMSGKLTRHDLKLAKELLRRKAVIGLYEDMPDTLASFSRYFGWNVSDSGSDSSLCLKKLLDEERAKEKDYERIQVGSDAWRLLLKQNKFDLELYDYVKELVAYQMGVMAAR